MSDEEYVRSVWGWLEVREQGYGSVNELQIVSEGFNIQQYPAKVAWSAAAEFTRERLEQIRQVEEEIATTRVDLGFAKTEHTRRVYSSILDREQDALAKLKRGMK